MAVGDQRSYWKICSYSSEVDVLLKEVLKTTVIRRVSYIKYVRRRKDFMQLPHRHAAFGHELVYVDYGRMDIMLEKRKLQLNPGECILIRGGTTHAFSGGNEMPFSYLNAMFRGTIDDSLYGNIIPVDRGIRHCMEQLKAETAIEAFLKDELVLCRFTELILLLLRFTLMKGTAVPEPGDAGGLNARPILPSGTLRRHSEFAGKAMKFIQENYRHPLDMEKLAGTLHVSKSHLRALLRQETGKNFTTLLHETRIAAAKHHLQESSRSLEEISAAVGYASPAFFFTIFRRFTGMTPREYSGMIGEIDFKGD